MEMPGGSVPSAPILKSPPAPVPRAWLVLGGRQFQPGSLGAQCCLGTEDRGICVDALVQQPVLHSANMLFLLLFQLSVIRDSPEDPGDLHTSSN